MAKKINIVILKSQFKKFRQRYIYVIIKMVIIMNINSLINKKQLGEELEDNEIKEIIIAYLKKEINDQEMTALLRAICANGMSEAETFSLTQAMIESGEKLDLGAIAGIKVDKHSTGGIGDKTTLVLVPLVAACDVPVVKMSGRSLGYTGGTIDKIEAIPGFRTSLSLAECVAFCQKIGVVLATQTGNLVPADKKLYALRDLTGTVESIPLIASSIMSKKIASGADKIVIDLKVGNGAFMKNHFDAQKLGNLMVKIGHNYGRETICLVTNMNEPLGYAVGNALEVIESIDVLKGNGPEDVKELTIALATQMVKMAKKIDLVSAEKMVREKLSNGQAYQKFEQFVNNQGGNLLAIKKAAHEIAVLSPKEGYIKAIDSEKIGELVRQLGGGRINKEDLIDHSVGLILNKKIGDYVRTEEQLMRVFYNEKQISLTEFSACYEIINEPVEKPPLIYDLII